MKPRKINDYKKVIFVEGDDDFHFLCNLLEIEGINDVHVEKIIDAENYITHRIPHQFLSFVNIFLAPNRR